jgi:hypothetical protein
MTFGWLPGQAQNGVGLGVGPKLPSLFLRDFIGLRRGSWLPG